MPVKLPKGRISGAILIGSLALSAAGCSLMSGEFAQRSVGTTAVSTGPGAVETKPAVLVDGAAANVATVTPPRASSLDGVPQLPKDNPPTATALSPTDKARVIAELEALARGEVPADPASATKPECAPAANAKPGVQTAALPASCTPAPKPALRP